MPHVEIRGDGVAGLCCAHLLKQAGVDVSVVPSERARVPALLISEAARGLLRDIFGMPTLLASRTPIRKRVVAWHRNSEPMELEHRGYLTSEQELLSELPAPDPARSEKPDWIIYSAQPLPIGVEHDGFGTRTALTWRVELRNRTARDACWIEAVDNGWLFLMPGADGTGWLLAMGDVAIDPLADSNLVRTQVRALVEHSPRFPVFPRIARTLTGPRWLACGSAVIGFDPICGDGTALAVRTAILATAVIRRALDGAEPNALLSHYEDRIRAGFHRHLEVCRSFYTSAQSSPWWRAEAAALQRAQPPKPPQFRYQLRGLSLEELPARTDPPPTVGTHAGTLR